VEIQRPLELNSLLHVFSLLRQQVLLLFGKSFTILASGNTMLFMSATVNQTPMIPIWDKLQITTHQKTEVATTFKNQLLNKLWRLS
jgi:hypothetical protein